MLESIKNKIWDLLKEKEISLAMLYNDEGEILWSRGRKISGKNIELGQGFSKTYLKNAIENQQPFEKEDALIKSFTTELTRSAAHLNIKSLIILPVGEQYFLYIDSGIKKSFSDSDRQVFRALGELLGQMIENIKKRQSDVGGISGSSEAIKKIREIVIKYSLEEEPILLLGETGTGKSHIAERIHLFSGRPGKFFTVNTPSIPEHLFESEIFGHKKGAFTDAKKDKTGYVDEAKGGTLFFDEIAEIPLSFQAKLLRFIEHKKYLSLGDATEKNADVRIVAATNRNLAKAVENKEFREDLYYRLNILTIHIPPLKERKSDLQALVKENSHYLKGKTIGPGFWETINQYHWPGNVRELITVLIRAGIQCPDPIKGKDILDVINQSQAIKPMQVNTTKAKQEKIWEAIHSGSNFWEVVKKPFLQRNLNREQVKDILLQALEECGGKYKNLLPLFNLHEDEYHKFMSFLSDNNLKMDRFAPGRK